MCPQCNEPMIVVEFDGVEVDHCLICRGIWLDGGELELIFELAGMSPGRLHQALSASAEGKPQKRRCPRCRRRMSVVEVGEAPAVAVDRCPRGHGLWLDDGELATLAREFGQQQDAAAARFLGELFHHGLTGQAEKG